jgi:hypothetical protein
MYFFPNRELCNGRVRQTLTSGHSIQPGVVHPRNWADLNGMGNGVSWCSQEHEALVVRD